MNHTSRSVFAFSIYFRIFGFILVLAPGFLFGLLNLPPAQDYWILVTGMLLVGLSMYSAFAAYKELMHFMRLTTIGRSLVLSYLVILVILQKAPSPIMILGMIDFVFALWTFIGFKIDQSNSSLRAA